MEIQAILCNRLRETTRFRWIWVAFPDPSLIGLQHQFPHLVINNGDLLLTSRVFYSSGKISRGPPASNTPSLFSEMSQQEKYTGEGAVAGHVPYDDEKRSDEAAVLDTQVVPADRYGRTRRGLKSRHIQLIALGGCTSLHSQEILKSADNYPGIGTGLFVGSGATLSLVGPASLFLAFCAMSAIL